MKKKFRKDKNTLFQEGYNFRVQQESLNTCILGIVRALETENYTHLKYFVDSSRSIYKDLENYQSEYDTELVKKSLEGTNSSIGHYVPVLFWNEKIAREEFPTKINKY